MNTDLSRPTFKRTLRRISVISVIITMTLIWLLLSVTSVLTLKQYAQQNLQMTGATMSRSLGEALYSGNAAAVYDTLDVLGKQGQYSAADVWDISSRHFSHWAAAPADDDNVLTATLREWILPEPVSQPVWYRGIRVGEINLTARDTLIGHFILLSLGVLTGSILFASGVALIVSRYLHNGIINALQNITDVVYDVRTHRNFSRRVADERIEEFHHFAQDFNSLLDEMEEWQLSLQAKNAQLLRTALHDPLTGLANRAAFRNAITALMRDNTAHACSALLFLDGDNFKFINDSWGHAVGDCVLIEVAKRLTDFGNRHHHTAYRLGGDEFAMILSVVTSEADVQRISAALSRQFDPPFDLHNGSTATMTLSIGYALTWEHDTTESLLDLADKNMYQVKTRHSRSLI